MISSWSFRRVFWRCRKNLPCDGECMTGGGRKHSRRTRTWRLRQAAAVKETQLVTWSAYRRPIDVRYCSMGSGKCIHICISTEFCRLKKNQCYWAKVMAWLSMWDHWHMLQASKVELSGRFVAWGSMMTLFCRKTWNVDLFNATKIKQGDLKHLAGYISLRYQCDARKTCKIEIHPTH